jgi:hypothetical protein
MARSNQTAALVTASLLVLGVATSASARPFIIEDATPADATTDAASNSIASRCGLLRTSADRSSASDCTSCHAAAEHATHPVEMNYEQARLGGSMMRDLRPASELRARGIRLVDGKVSCVTCHDAGSRVANHLALPPGSTVQGAINLRNPATYTLPARTMKVEQVEVGAAVSPTALCKACHALD